jgi:hypothetical protein
MAIMNLAGEVEMLINDEIEKREKMMVGSMI